MMKRRQALYQVHRPKSFKDIYGQDLILEVLKNSIIFGRVQNGYIFEGKYGTGKTSTARIFAAALNCPKFSNNKEVCEEDCFVCKSIYEGHPDIIEIDAASNSGVDYIRSLKHELNLAPIEFERKVYIIDEAHMLSRSAWDAMLKILEDPNLKVTFIFATTESLKVPKTIKSRCIGLTFRSLSESHIEKWISNILNKEEIKFDKKAIQVILAVSNGSFRDALTLIDKKILLSKEDDLTEDAVSEVANIPTPSDVKKWLMAMAKFDIDSVTNTLKHFFESGYDSITLVRLSVSIAKNILQSKIRTKDAPVWAKIVEMLYGFLKDARSIFNPEISLEILVLRFLLVETNIIVPNEVEKTKIADKKNEEKETITSSHDKVNSTIDIQKEEVKNTFSRGYDRLNEQEDISISKTINIEEIIPEEKTTETLNEEKIEESGKLEETEEISEDSIDIELSDTLIDFELKRESGKENEELEGAFRKISKEKLLETKKLKDLEEKRKNEKALFRRKISNFVWGLIMSNQNKNSLEVLNPNWKLDLNGILSHMYHSYEGNSSEVNEIKNNWRKINEHVLNETTLPYSALLLDAQVAMLSEKVIYIVYENQMRAALINRMSRTIPFLTFIKKLLGNDYWIIALGRREWTNAIDSYHNEQQLSKDKMKDLEKPSTPPIINKTFIPAKKAKSELLQKLDNDPELKDYEIREEN